MKNEARGWKRPFRLSFIISLALLSLFSAFPQETESREKAEETSGETAEEPPIPEKKLEPVFPLENRDLIFVEGEDAVSTNFNKEPTLNYATSGSRALQLNRTTGLQGGTAFYADFVFYVPEGGTFELWYGGTPPGPLDELYPAYASPFRYHIDKEEPRDVYREDVILVEQYTPVYYWNLVGERELTAGRHTLRFLVDETRNHDARYFFYMDCFFLVRTSDGKRSLHDPLPDVFPKNPDDRSIDYPFRALEDYQIVIRDAPQNPEPYVELSTIYSLVGDYLNALKYLRRAIALDPNNADLLLLQVKNQLWKGDVKDGLDGYWDLLVLEPDRLDRWMEAGKVAAWSGIYDESVAFFKAGLKRFPESKELLVSLGFTYLWSARGREAEEQFDQARGLAGDDPESMINLAEIFRINGDPERAADLYRESIRRHPDYLEAYLLLQEHYFRRENTDRYDDLTARIEASFLPSEKLNQTLELFREKMGMKLQVMAEYEKMLAENPDNLQLREILAQTYFWNGYRRKGIDEYRNILLNQSFQTFKRLAADSPVLMELIDKSYIYGNLFRELPDMIQESARNLESALSEYLTALKSLESFLAKVETARNKGEELPVPQGEDPQDTVNKSAGKLAEYYQQSQQLLAASRDLVTSFESDYLSDTGPFAPLRAKEAADYEAFQNVIRINRWRWDRSSYTAELQQSEDQFLARFILGQLALSEGRLSTAEKSFSLEDLTHPLAFDFQYGLFQSILRQGRVDEALVLLDESPTPMETAVPYLALLKPLSLSLQTDTAPTLIDVDETLVQHILQDLAQIRSAASQRVAMVDQSQREMISLLSKRQERYVYNFQQNTYLTRRELGDYYLAEEELEAAIYQFQQVLAIDPWDLGTIYRLGNVYRQIGNWRQAMRNYERIYYQDPLYENAAHLYNELSRQNADTAAFSTYTLADTTRMTLHAEASMVHPLGTHIHWRLLYENDSTRIFQLPETLNPSIYRVQTLSLGLPLLFPEWKLTLVPMVGIMFWNELLGETTGAGSQLPVLQFLGYGGVNPVLGLNVSSALGSYVYLDGGYRYERQEETYAPPRAAVYSHSGELGLGTSFAFIDLYPFRDSSMRTYGKIAYLTDGNLMYEALQELTIGLLTLDKPKVILRLSGNVLFQDSMDDKENYYAPQEVLVAGGGILASAWLPVGEESSLGLSLRASGGYFAEHLLDPAQRIHRAQMDIEGNVEYVKGEAVYFAGAQFTTTYRFTPPIVTTPWDYWMLFLRAGFTTRLPRLLAP